MTKVAAVAAVGLALLCAFIICIALLVTGGPPGGLGAASGQQGLPGVVCAPAGGAPGQAVAGFANDQLANAALIVAAGAEVSVSQRGQVIAVATAMAESGLRNLDHGDHDSVGLFQQRASWGPAAVRMDPKASAHLFYQHLLAVPGWQTLPLTVAAQDVQISALPDAYAKWEQAANQVVGSVLHISCSSATSPAPGGPAPGTVPGPSGPATALARLVIARATAQVGTPYAWGGGDAAGPTHGVSDGGGAADQHGDTAKVGFDCSGLMVYVFAGAGIAVPHQTQAIWAQFPPPITDRARVQPGDMILLSANGRPGGIDHVGLYLGNGQAVDAPQSGLNVRIESNIWAPGSYWATHFIGAVRASAPTQDAGSRA